MPDATLVSWNVAGRIRRQATQAERVAALSPDIVCLQEVTARSAQPWTEALHAAGLTDVVLPERNRGDLDDVPEEVRDAMTFHFAMTVDEVLAVALEPAPLRQAA